MSETRYVRGGGGGIVEMTVPPLGTSRRENFDYMLARGELSFVTEEVEEYTTRGGGLGLRLKHEPTTHWEAEDPGDLEECNRDQLLAVARVRGIEVDGRASKPNLLKALVGAEQEPDAPPAA